MQTAEKSQTRVDIVDDLLFVGDFLAGAARSADRSWHVGISERGWIAYILRNQLPGSIVIVRGELSDHVPTVLKVRALAAEGATVIVLADCPSRAHRERLYHSGAARILTREDNAELLLAVVDELSLGGAGRSPRAPTPGLISEVYLSDRELQCACLYSGRAALSARVISERLGLPLDSVRTHVQRARSALRVVGPTSTREGLRRALISDGWLDR